MIRTMKDDLREVSTKVVGGPAKVDKGPSATLLPLPPKPTAKYHKVVVPPAPRHRRGRRRGLAMLFLLFMLITLGGSAALWWLDLPAGLEGLIPLEITSQEAAPAEDIIPRSSAVVLQYNIAETEARQQLLSAWQGESGAASSESLLAGDPRLLLAEADMASFYYVMLEDEVRPYLVVPKTSDSKAILEHMPAGQVSEIQGWYVANSVGTRNYLSALESGALGKPADSFFAEDTVDNSPGKPLRIWLGTHALMALRETLLGSDLTQGWLQNLSLIGQFGQVPGVIHLTGRGESLAATGGELADHQILAAIPEEAEFIHLGGNLAEDLLSWAPQSGVIDMPVLEEPAVAGLLAQLAVPYGFYSVSPNPSVRDVGLIVALPEEVVSTFRPPPSSAGRPSSLVEEALRALVPLVTGRKAVGPIDWSDNTHAGVPLRYANFSQPSQALDYAIADSYLAITTSRESMFSALETITGDGLSVATSPVWQELRSAWGVTGWPAAPHLLLGSVAVPHFAQLFPAQKNSVPLFSMTFANNPLDNLGAVLNGSGVLMIP